MKYRNISILLAGSTLPLLTGCKIVKIGVLSVAAVVGLAGYAVYKTGDVAVTGVKKVAGATGDAGKAAGTVVFFNGSFKTEHPYGIRYVSMGTLTALRNAGFRETRNSTDALSGEITAKTRTGTEIKINLKNISTERTSLSIRVGVKGNLEESEKINNMITRELDLMYQKANPAKQPQQA